MVDSPLDVKDEVIPSMSMLARDYLRWCAMFLIAEMERSESSPLESNSESEAGTSAGSADTQRSYKQQKMELLNKTWPWADENKPIYKVKWLEERISKEQLHLKKPKNTR
ncbi:hypothetical protein EVAR_59841_1 [Eumeta japonica]|uniref:Uncharacterized protein n=1 Tax=Eumeta variegata TaxID=151549 RepID=A0A4C1Z3B8_EUMVA|nr:hypothetical protein EVAR_59841_1 [Eumeta japonica]